MLQHCQVLKGVSLVDRFPVAAGCTDGDIARTVSQVKSSRLDSGQVKSRCTEKHVFAGLFCPSPSSPSIPFPFLTRVYL